MVQSWVVDVPLVMEFVELPSDQNLQYMQQLPS